jgi:HK97 family phage portal protein
MGVFDFLKNTTKAVNPRVFSFLSGQSAPSAKTIDYLGSYEGWVYACVKAIADAVSQMELKLQRKSGDRWEDVDEHIALQTLRYVNTHQTTSELVFATQAFQELGGDTFWYLPKGGMTKKPAEIWTLDPSRMWVVKDSREFVKGYVFKSATGDQIPLTTDKVIHFKTFNPQNPYRGLGTVQAAALAIDTDKYASQYNRNFFLNSALPSGTLEAEGTLTDAQFNRIREQWNARYQGTDNAHKVAILEGGLKFNSISVNQRDMQFLEQRQFSRDEILALFRVPKSLLGLAEDFNRANIEGVEYNFIKYVVKPKMQFIVDRLNEFYLPLFGVNTKDMRFALVDPVPEDKEAKLKERESALKNGYATINEVRELDGKNPVEGGDIVYLPGTLKPITMLGQEPQPQDDDGGKDEPKEEEKEKVYKGYQDAVGKRIAFIDDATVRAKRRFKRIYRKQRDQLIGRLTDGATIKSVTKDNTDNMIRLLFENWDDWIGILHDASEKTMSESLLEAGKFAVAQVGADVTFDLLNPRVLNWLNENALTHAKSINNTVRDEVTLRLMEGVEQGLGAEEIAQSIKGFFDDQSGWRALRVARTEVMAGYGQGTLEGYRQTGVVKGKKWLSAGDATVCPVCKANEEQGSVPLETPFQSGHMTNNAHPNCRCIIQPLV